MKYLLLLLLMAMLVGSGLVVANGRGVLLPEVALLGVIGGLCGAYLYVRAGSHRVEWALFGLLANTDALVTFSIVQVTTALWSKRYQCLALSRQAWRAGNSVEPQERLV